MSRNSNSNPAQRNMVLAHLEKYGSITPKQAEERYGIMRLGARIFELREIGYPIMTTMQKSKNRFGVETAYAKYILKRRPNDEYDF